MKIKACFTLLLVCQTVVKAREFSVYKPYGDHTISDIQTALSFVVPENINEDIINTRFWNFLTFIFKMFNLEVPSDLSNEMVVQMLGPIIQNQQADGSSLNMIPVYELKKDDNFMISLYLDQVTLVYFSLKYLQDFMVKVGRNEEELFNNIIKLFPDDNNIKINYIIDGYLSTLLMKSKKDIEVKISYMKIKQWNLLPRGHTYQLYEKMSDFLYNLHAAQDFFKSNSSKRDFFWDKTYEQFDALENKLSIPICKDVNFRCGYKSNFNYQIQNLLI